MRDSFKNIPAPSVSWISCDFTLLKLEVRTVAVVSFNKSETVTSIFICCHYKDHNVDFTFGL